MSMTFHYNARTAAGRRVTGVMRAADRRAAFATLRDRLLLPFSLEPVARRATLKRLLLGGNARERLAFFRAYAALEHAGIDFSTSFDLLAAQSQSDSFREAIRGVRADVELHGERLWTAMSHRPDDFTDLEVAMVAAGEEAGNRELVFDKLAEFLERDERLRKRLSAVMLYPVIVLCGAAMVVTYLLFGVIPQFVHLFQAFDVGPLPLLVALTRLTAFSTNPVALGIVASVAGMSAFVAQRFLRSADGSLAIDRIRTRIPLLGPLVRKLNIARLLRVLATLLEAGVNQLRSLDVAGPVVESPLLTIAVQRARESLESGAAASLDEAFALAGSFEPLILGFMRVGRHAGDVPHMLSRMADYYEDEAQSMLTALPQVVQSVVTLALGLLVTAIVYIVYVPLSTLSSSIR
jgi:type IV pilus assembly protein PilC